MNIQHIETHTVNRAQQLRKGRLSHVFVRCDNDQRACHLRPKKTPYLIVTNIAHTVCMCVYISVRAFIGTYANLVEDTHLAPILHTNIHTQRALNVIINYNYCCASMCVCMCVLRTYQTKYIVLRWGCRRTDNGRPNQLRVIKCIVCIYIQGGKVVPKGESRIVTDTF